MSTPLVVTGIWFVAANVLAMLPSRDGHRKQAAVLIACGVPLLGWLTLAHGPVVGAFALAGGASVLRWPLLRLSRKVLGG